MGNARRRGRATVAAFAAAAMAVGIAGGFLLKYQCFNTGPKESGYHYIHNCYSDIVSLYGKRKPQFNPQSHPVPFAAHGLAYKDNRFEYPALTGLFVSGVNSAVDAGDKKGFFDANAAGLAIVAIAGAATLGTVLLNRKRILLMAVAPAMLSYAFLSWDLLPIGLVCAAIAAYAFRKDGIAGLLLGFGAAAKLFPALAVPAFLIAARRDGRSWKKLLGLSIAGFAIPNLIVLAYAGVDGWWFPWAFQSQRPPNIETGWFFMTSHFVGSILDRPGYLHGSRFAAVTQVISTMMLVAGVAALLWRESRRPVFRPYVSAFGCVIIFIVTSKVISPQYMIWLLPFFVVVRVPWHAFAAYAVADIFELASIWALGTALINKSPTRGYFVVLEIAVWARYAALLYVLWWTRRADEALPSSKVAAVPAN